eukprot:2833467-Rhodomonas_salina.4
MEPSGTSLRYLPALPSYAPPTRCLVLRDVWCSDPYAMPGTIVLYDEWCYESRIKCPVLRWCMVLRQPYTMPGTEEAYGAARTLHS